MALLQLELVDLCSLVVLSWDRFPPSAVVYVISCAWSCARLVLSPNVSVVGAVVRPLFEGEKGRVARVLFRFELFRCSLAMFGSHHHSVVVSVLCAGPLFSLDGRMIGDSL